MLSSLVYNTISLQTLRINEFLISVRKHIKNEQRKLSMDPNKLHLHIRSVFSRLELAKSPCHLSGSVSA